MTPSPPPDASASPTQPTALRWVKLSFVDVFGTNCALTLPADRLGEATEAGILFDGSSLEGPARYLESDMRLRADPATLIDHGDGHGRVVCTVLTPGGTPWPGDPRTALGDALVATAELAEDYSVSAELEFYLLTPDGEPIDQAGYFDDQGGMGLTVVKAAADELVATGVPVLSAHHEGGPGQFELDLGPLDALALADALVTAKESLRRLAEAAGLVATFMAQPLSGQPGSGLHLHQRAGYALVEASGSLTDDGRSFVAGQLGHASGLCALAAPTVNSYRRLHAGPEAPSAAIWSTANRAALIRVSTSTGADATIEFRGADPMANPYLLLAGLLTAGAAGIAEEAELGHPSDEAAGSFDPSLAARFDPLPRNLDEALDALAADDVLTEAFDPGLVTNLVTGRRAELEQFRTHVTSWSATATSSRRRPGPAGRARPPRIAGRASRGAQLAAVGSGLAKRDRGSARPLGFALTAARGGNQWPLRPRIRATPACPSASRAGATSASGSCWWGWSSCWPGCCSATTRASSPGRCEGIQNVVPHRLARDRDHHELGDPGGAGRRAGRRRHGRPGRPRGARSCSPAGLFAVGAAGRGAGAGHRRAGGGAAGGRLRGGRGLGGGPAVRGRAWPRPACGAGSSRPISWPSPSASSWPTWSTRL